MTKSLSPFYFFAGLLCGIFAGVSVDRAWSTIVARVVSAGIFILLAFFWRRFEAAAHKHYIENWPARRARGKWYFVLTEYVLIRGALIFFAIAGPTLPTVKFTSATVGVLFVSLVLVMALFGYFGLEAWASCEKEYLVRSLRNAAAQSRIESN